LPERLWRDTRSTVAQRLADGMTSEYLAEPSDAGHFRGPRSMYEARRFQPVERLERYTVMRRPAPNA
jgi:hypothetical protein